MIPTNDRLIRMVIILKTLFIFIIGKIVAFIMRGNTTKIQFPGASLYPVTGREPYFNGALGLSGPGNSENRAPIFSIPKSINIEA
jgi:hypothetical protein